MDCASPAGSLMWLKLTSCASKAARMTRRPILPKPLIPMLIAIELLLREITGLQLEQPNVTVTSPAGHFCPVLAAS